MPERDNPPDLEGMEYARAYETGALAALNYITDEREDLEGLTMRVAEKIGQNIDVMLGSELPPRT